MSIDVAAATVCSCAGKPRGSQRLLPPNEPFDPGLHNALLQLTPDQREVVTLRFVADLAIEEVARITGRPVGAVKSLQHRALRTLASALSIGGEPLLRGPNAAD